MSVNNALNVAKLAMQKYFMEVTELKVGSTLSDIKPTRDEAVAKIMEFAKEKRKNHEKELTPYEKKSLGTFDAADLILMQKLNMTSCDLYGGDGHADDMCECMH
jgi:hypothetical protein